jgi:hypothetical protein
MKRLSTAIAFGIACTAMGACSGNNSEDTAASATGTGSANDLSGTMAPDAGMAGSTTTGADAMGSGAADAGAGGATGTTGGAAGATGGTTGMGGTTTGGTTGSTGGGTTGQ